MHWMFVNNTINSITILYVIKFLLINIISVSRTCADENHHDEPKQLPVVDMMAAGQPPDDRFDESNTTTDFHCTNCTRSGKMFTRDHTLITRLKIGGYIFLATLFLGVSWYTITYYLGKREIQRDPWKYQGSIRREMLQPPIRLKI